VNLKIIAILEEAADYYEKEMTPGQVQIYLRNLSDVDINLLRTTLDRYIQSGSQWFPKVSELRRLAEKINGSPDLSYYYGSEHDIKLFIPDPDTPQWVFEAETLAELFWRFLESKLDGSKV
jgi:hypothetical protein